MKSPVTGKEMVLARENRKLTFRKEEFEIVYHYYACTESGETFTSEQLDNLNMNQLYNQYRVKFNLPFPHKIKSIREKYDNEKIDWDFDDEDESPIPFEFQGHEEFYYYLTNNDILEPFISNYNEFNNNGYILNKFLNRYETYSDYINFAFTWKDTPEGYDFWNEFYKKNS